MGNSSNTAVLVGDVLVDDLTTVLDKDFGSRGCFAHSSNRPDAPNPFLTITDVGLIGLPLSEIDAKRIIACATQTSFGLETSTVIDKEGRDTWQIDPSLVSFQNPTWDSFLQSNIANISSGLGLAGGYDKQYKLHQLLLYETGSHFRPCQDTQKEDGIFATMAIVLPSQYTGGEIIVSHGLISKVMDVSASCMTSTNVLSWYTDVKHEVKPIRSGYRLVLSYNLIRCGPEFMHTADNANELSRLHEILERWRTGGYKQLPEQRMVAFVLGHQYSESDLDMGRAALKMEDAHKVNEISSVAEMLSFELWLAKYERCTARLPEDENNEGSDGDRDEDDPSSNGEQIWGTSGQVIEDLCTLKYLTDLQGNRVFDKIQDFDSKGLIMGDPDHMGDPDDKRFEPGSEESSDTIKHYSRRAVLVIFHKEDMDRVMIFGCGVKSSLQNLTASLPYDPTLEDRKIADLLLECAAGTYVWKCTAICSLVWRDLDLWNRTIERCPSPSDSLQAEIFFAWDIFSFRQLQRSYDIIVSKIFPSHIKHIDFIHQVKERAASLDSQEIAETWCGEQIIGFMKGSYAVNRNALMSIAKEDGIKFLKEFNNEAPLWDGLSGPKVYEQIISLFMSEKENIYASPANEAGRNNGEDLDQIFEDFFYKCIQGAIHSLDENDYLWSIAHRKLQLDNILQVMELCITTNRVDECATLFRLIWDAKSDAYNKLMFYYIPLTLRLKGLGTNLLLPPFASFVRNVIGYYLSQMLGSKTHDPRPSPQMLLCDQTCSTCAKPREFLEQFYVPVQDFCVSRKTLIEGKYRVTKRLNFLNSNRWEYRLERARDLLDSIGDVDYIEQLMGEQFEELKVALKGECSYNYTGPLPKHEPEDDMDSLWRWKVIWIPELLDMEQDEM